MSRNVCVMGDNVAGGAQAISTRAASLADLRADISSRVRFEPADYNQIVHLQFLNPTFNEWMVVPENLEGLSIDAKVHLSCEKNTISPLQAAFLGAVVEVFLERASSSESQRIHQALAEGMNLLKAGGLTCSDVVNTAAFKNVAQLVRRLGSQEGQRNAAGEEIPAAVSQMGSAGHVDTEAVRRNKSSRPSSAARVPVPQGTPARPVSRSGAASEGDCSETPAGARKNKSGRPASTTGESAADGSSVVASSVQPPVATTGETVKFRHLSDSLIPNVSNAPAIPGSDDITIYCVYSGTTTQRAKAIRSSRSAPSLESLMSTLRAKFNADLALGHIEASGVCTEVLSSQDLKVLIATRAGYDSLTLHCWARATVSFDEDGGVGHSGGGSLVPADAQSAGSGRRSVRSSRPTSADPKAAAIAKRKVDKCKPSFPNDSSGVAWTQEQIEELFHAVDVDGSGYLTKEEMMDYFRANHDTMGVEDAEKKFANLLDSSAEMSDGMITIEEFSMVCLKLAQW